VGSAAFERIYERQWVHGFICEIGLVAVEHIPNIIYVFEYDGAGIAHVYTAPPDLWYDEGKELTPYSLPRTDVQNSGGSQSGYVMKSGRLYLYHILSGHLRKLYSENLGRTWSEETTVISDPVIENAFCIEYNGIECCIAIDEDGNMKCYRTNNHFDETWNENNTFDIATDIDKTAQPVALVKNGFLYAYAIKDSEIKRYRSADVGRTWKVVV